MATAGSPSATMSSSLVSHRSGASAAAASRKPTVHVCAQLGGQPRPTKAQPARAATVVASSATMAFPMEQQGLAGWWQGVVTSLAPEREQEQDW